MLKIEKAPAELFEKIGKRKSNVIYPLAELEVGEMFFSPFSRYKNQPEIYGCDPDKRTIGTMRNSIMAIAKRHEPKKFACVRHYDSDGVCTGLDVVRVA